MRQPLPFIGRRIQRARESHSWTQAQLAVATGLQPAAVSHFETGQRMPNARNLRKLAIALNCSADYLLGIVDWGKQ